jgi:hypothetical protein
MKVLGNITRSLASGNRIDVMEMIHQEFGIEVGESQADEVVRRTRCRMGRHDPAWCRCQEMDELSRLRLERMTPEEREEREKRIAALGRSQRVEPCDTDMRIIVKAILIGMGAFGNGGGRYSVQHFGGVPMHVFPLYFQSDEERRRLWSRFDEWKEAVGVAVSKIERTAVLLTPIDRVARRVTRMMEDKYEPHRFREEVDG